MSGGFLDRPARRMCFVIGAALIVGGAVLNLVRDDEPIRSAGRVPLKLQELIEQVVAAGGGRVSPEGCTMIGNLNLGATCRAAGINQAMLTDTLAKMGWQPTSGPPLAAEGETGAFVRGDEYLEFAVSRERSVVLVSARMRRP